MSATAIERITLRDYRPGDFDGLLALDQVCFPAEVACLNADLKAALGNAQAISLIAECEGRGIAGFVVASVKTGAGGHVITLDVEPRFRRIHVGERLMLAVEKRLEGLGVKRIRLEVGSSNTAAQLLYEKLGFRQTGFIQHYYGDGGDAWVMEKHGVTDTTPKS